MSVQLHTANAYACAYTANAYACAYTCIDVCVMYMHAPKHTHAHTHTQTHTHTHKYMYVRVYVCVFADGLLCAHVRSQREITTMVIGTKSKRKRDDNAQTHKKHLLCHFIL